MKRSLIGLSLVLVVVGMVAVAGPVSRRAQRAWSHHTAAVAWEENLAFSLEPSCDEPVARIKIPAVDLDTWVLGGATADHLHRFPSREQVGRSTLIMAHRDTDFRPLIRLAAGQDIELQAHDGSRRRYRVLEILVVEAGRAEELIEDQRYRERLLLLTCYPFRYLGSAPERFLALAAPLGGDDEAEAQNIHRP